LNVRKFAGRIFLKDAEIAGREATHPFEGRRTCSWVSDQDNRFVGIASGAHIVESFDGIKPEIIVFCNVRLLRRKNIL
jgi:hypothetical protein